MRTHSDIGLVIADLLQLARFWLSIVCVTTLKSRSSHCLHCLDSLTREQSAPQMTDIACMTQRLITR